MSSSSTSVLVSLVLASTLYLSSAVPQSVLLHTLQQELASAIQSHIQEKMFVFAATAMHFEEGETGSRLDGEIKGKLSSSLRRHNNYLLHPIPESMRIGDDGNGIFAVFALPDNMENIVSAKLLFQLQGPETVTVWAADTNQHLMHERQAIIRTIDPLHDWHQVELVNFLQPDYFTNQKKVFVYIECEGCALHEMLMGSDGSNEMSSSSLLLGVTAPSGERASTRVSRSAPVDCVNGCCHSEYNLNLTNLVHYHEILFPTIVPLNLCLGSCRNANLWNATTTTYNARLRFMMLLHASRQEGQALRQLSPTCTPTAYEPVQLVTTSGTVQISNLKAAQCGCS